MWRGVYVLTLLLSTLSYSYAETFYVDANIDGFFSDGSADSPKKTIAAGLELLSDDGGDTLIIKPGTYAENITDIANGKPGAYNIIKAETDGTVIIKGGMDLPYSTQYIQFEGLKWDSHQGKHITGHHIKLLRCALKGGPVTNNNVNLGIGTNDHTPGAHHILIEDSWVYGEGGRYNILIYNSDSIVLRRVVIRHDGGWAGNGYDPEAGVSIYNSSNVDVQNAIVLDSDLKYQYWTSAFYNVKNDSSATPHSNTRIAGSIVLNAPHGGAYGYDDGGAMKDARLENSIAWNSGAGIFMNGDNKNVTAKNITLGHIASTGVAIWGGKKNSIDISQSIFYKIKYVIKQNAGNIRQNNNSCFPLDLKNCIGASALRDPLSNGLRYLPTVLPNSFLNDGKTGVIGASIINRIGKDGSLYGEPGFADTTTTSIWPWPNEQRIKADLCSATDRGLCHSPASLTLYIWNYLGNNLPDDCGYSRTFASCLKAH